MATARRSPTWKFLALALLLSPLGCAAHHSVVGDLAQGVPAGSSNPLQTVTEPASFPGGTAASAGPGTAANSPTGTGAPEPARGQAADLGASGHRLRPIHFEFDSHLLDESARATLQENAAYLTASRSAPVRVEGHCDERGSAEYNLALGERRAQTAADYLRDLGVSPERLQVVSFGEERPLDPNHSEPAWASNRRAEFVEIAR